MSEHFAEYKNFDGFYKVDALNDEKDCIKVYVVPEFKKTAMMLLTFGASDITKLREQIKQANKLFLEKLSGSAAEIVRLEKELDRQAEIFRSVMTGEQLKRVAKLLYKEPLPPGKEGV